MLALGSLVLTACARQVDRFTIDRVVDRAVGYPDVDLVCGIGRALTHPVGALPRNDPDRALLIAEGVAGLCAQTEAWQEELAQIRSKRNLQVLGAARAAEITDARIRAERAHATAASRFERSWQHLLSAWPGSDQGQCGKVKDKDEFVYAFGLVTGMMALLHDRSGGGHEGIGLDRPLEVARASTCLPDDAWWSLPRALRSGAWATVPGSAPEGVDPWAELEAAAQAGATTGIRASAAIRVLIAANAGRSDIVEQGIRTYPTLLEAPDKQWQLLDAYATLVIQHQSDLIWARATGHRTETLGVLPSDDANAPPESPFGGADPFGAADPFGTPDPAQPDPEESEETP